MTKVRWAFFVPPLNAVDRSRPLHTPFTGVILLKDPPTLESVGQLSHPITKTLAWINDVDQHPGSEIKLEPPVSVRGMKLEPPHCWICLQVSINNKKTDHDPCNKNKSRRCRTFLLELEPELEQLGHFVRSRSHNNSRILHWSWSSRSRSRRKGFPDSTSLVYVTIPNKANYFHFAWLY